MKVLYEFLYKYFENNRYSYLEKKLQYIPKKVNLGGHFLTCYKSPEKGKPMVFIHGLLDASFGFRKLAPLIKKEYQKFLFDIPGFGRSPLPKIRYLFQLDIFSKMIYTAICRLDLENVTLVGHSMGGLIAQHIALFDKKNPKPKIKKIVLISSGGIPHHKRDEMREILFPKNKKELERLLGYLYFEKFPEPNFLIQSTLVHTWNSIEHKYLAENTIEKEDEIFFGKKAGEIKIPTLILSGNEDEITHPKMMKTLAGYIKKSKLKLIPSAKHAIHLEKPEILAEEINSFIS